MRDDIKKKSELIKELQSLRKKVATQESSLNKYESMAKKNKSVRDIEKRYKLISENSDDVIWLLDLKTLKFIYVSPSIVKLRGYTPEEVLKQTVKDVLTEESYKNVQGKLSYRISAFESGDESARVSLDEIEQMRKDGSLINTEIVTTLLKNKKGRVHQILGVTRNLTERKLAKLAIAENEKRYKTLFDLSPAGITLLDTEGIILDLNEAACKITGYSREELIGRNIRILSSPSHHPEIDKNIARIIAGESLDHEVINIRKDGALCIMEIRESLIQLPDGSSGILSITSDITERIKAEEKISENENKFRSIFENSFDAIGVSRSGIHLFVNPAYLSLFGYSNNEELVGKPILNLIAANQHEDILDRIKKRSRGEILQNAYTTRGLRKDGTEFDMDVHSSSHQLEGEPYTIVILRDITERIKAEEALRKSEERYRELFENNPHPMWVYDVETLGIIEVNDAAVSHYGYSREEFLSMTIKDLRPSEELPKFKKFLSNLKEPLKQSSGWKHIKKDGTIIEVEISSHILPKKGEHGLRLILVNDITERRKAEEELQKSEDRFRRLFEEDLAANFVSTVDGKLLMCNSAYLNMFKFSSMEEALSTSGFDNYPKPTARSEFLDLLRSEGRVVNYEETLRRQDGAMIDIIENVIGHFDENGELYELSGYMYDQTDRKRAAELIKLSEEKFNKSFHSSPIAMAIQDYKGSFIDVNESFLNMLESSLEDIIGFRGEELKLWAYENERINAEILFREQGVLQNFEFRFRTKSGKIGSGIIWAESISISGRPSVLTSVLNITDRKIMEAALKESEEKYRNIFNLAPVGIFQSTTDGKYISVNERMVQILGYDSKEELMQCDIGTDIYLNKEERKKVIDNYESDDPNAEQELRWKKKGGKPIWIELTAQSIKDASGKTLHYEGFIRDISSRKEAETKLRENQKLLSLVIETMPIGIWLIDSEGKVMHGNSAAQDIWGGAKFIGIEKYHEYKTWDLSNNSITLENSSIVRALKKGEPTINEELRIQRFDNRERFILNSAVPIHNSQKEIVGVVVINQDVTDQRSKEIQIRKLSGAVEQSTVSVFITDLQGRIEYVNKKFVESTGFSREEILGKSPSILKSGNAPVELYKNMWETISAGNEWRGELLNKTKDGSLFWEFEIISPIRNSSGVITNYLAVKEDITNQKKMTEELIAAKEHAERSDNIKTEFLAQMSHEVRTPLNVLLSYSTYIKEELEERKHLTQDLEQYFDTAAEAGKRIIRTIELILNMAEVKSGSYPFSPVKTDIYNDIITQIYHQFSRGMQKKKLNFEIIQKCEPVLATVDLFSVEQIITQLVNNAMIFTINGHVKIITEKNSKNNLVVKVEDTGIGIGPEYLKKLYTPFTQEDQGYSRSYEGNGLGLALTKKYCELNNIRIDVQSEKEKGTVFTLTFPEY